MLNEEKQKIYDAVVKDGQSCFITGEAGTGKSYLVNHIIEGLKTKHSSSGVILCGTTGIAAVNVGGTTLNSAFNYFMPAVGSLNYPPRWSEDKIEIMKRVKVIIIDEVSMLRCDTLDFINEVFLFNTGFSLSGVQMVMVGDMKQLPPVVKTEDIPELLSQYPQCRDVEGYKKHKFGWNYSYFYRENKDNFKIYTLKEVFRQRDPEFIEALNTVRKGGYSNYFQNYVDKPKGVFLASTNNVVSDYNRTKLAEIDSKEFIFKATTSGNFNPNDYLFEETLVVKDGARVMYLSNSNGLHNGICGTLNITDKKALIFVKDSGERIEIKPEEKIKVKYNSDGELITDSSIVQYPIKLAYAITIHKSQGLSLDEVTVDERKMFANGMFYVALSRAKSPEKLYIFKG